MSAAGAALLALALAVTANGFSCRPGARPVVFNFGDSNSDTGSMAAAMGWHLTHLLPPPHRTVLRRPPHHRLPL
jgi:hypothetical protein